MPLLTARAQSLASPRGPSITAWQRDLRRSLRDLSLGSRALVVVQTALYSCTGVKPYTPQSRNRGRESVSPSRGDQMTKETYYEKPFIQQNVTGLQKQVAQTQD